MANFFTRLAERSLGLSPVVQPAIASRFSFTSAILAAEDALRNGRAEFPPTSADSNPSIRVTSPAPISPVPAQFSTEKPDLAIDPTQEQVQPFSRATPSLPHPSRTAAATSPEFTLQPLISTTTDAIATAQSNREEVSQSVSPEPFRELQLRQQISGERSPFLVSTLPEPEVQAPAITASNSSPLQPLTPQPHHDRPMESKQIPRTQLITQTDLRSTVESKQIPRTQLITQTDLRSTVESKQIPRTQPITQTDLPLTVEGKQIPQTQPITQTDLHSTLPASPFPQVQTVPAAPFPQTSGRREVTPPTIHVRIGRVEVRAIVPTPSTPKVAPARPRPAVSLNEYLKQRRDKS
jgi:hypothetical protein